jgi:hypothetical protein
MAPSRFTALILFTGSDRPEASSVIFETLSPFAISVIDSRHFVVRDRVFSTALIALHPAHAPAIEADLIAAAERIGFDVAIDLNPESEDERSEPFHRYALTSDQFSAEELKSIYELLAHNGLSVTMTSVTKTASGHELICESVGGDGFDLLRTQNEKWKRL